VSIKGFTALSLLVVSMAAFCPPAAAQSTAISLEQAVRQGKVDVEAVSLGGATGNTVRVNVQRKGKETVRINVTPGTVFLTAANRQNMTGGSIQGEFTSGTTYRPTSVMVLSDNVKRGFLVQSFCLDYHKSAPQQGETFSLAVRDERAMRILQSAVDIQVTPWAVQCAIWMDRAGVSAEDIKKRFPSHVTDVEIAGARKLLSAAEKKGVESIPATIAPDVRVEVAKIYSPDPAVRAKAVDVLVNMGQRAAPAVSIIAANVLDQKAEHPLPPAVVKVNVYAGDVLDQLEHSGIAALGPWVRTLRESGVAGSVDVNIQAGEAILVDRFIANLKNANPRVRQRAALILGMSKEPRAVEPLIGALADGDAAVRDRAAESLAKITGKDFGKDQAKWRQWLKETTTAASQPKSGPTEM
jgi:hypothetical protein